jgi:HK97 family phage portal protein
MGIIQTLFQKIGYAPIEQVQTAPDEQRSNLTQPEKWFMDWATGGTVAGVAVTKETVLAISAVYACCRIRANAIASLSLGLYERLSNGDIRPVEDLPEYDIVCSEPNPLYTKYTFDSTTMFHESLHGNGYAKLYFGRGGRISAMEIMQPDLVQVYYEKGKLFYIYDNPYTYTREVLSDWEVLHFKGDLSDNGLIGKSPLQVAKSTFGMAIAANKYAESMYKNGGYLKGVVEMDGSLKMEQIAELRRSFMSVMQDYENTASVAVLGGGAKYKQMSMSPKDVEFIAASKMTVHDVCRYYGIPPHMVAEMDRATFSNIEHQSIELVMHTIRPIVKNRESELNRRILRKSDKKNLFYRYNIDSLLRGDSAARAAFYTAMLDRGVFNIDEVRQLENWNNLPDDLGKAHYRPLNMVEIGKEPDPALLNNDPAATGQQNTDNGTPQEGK